MNGFETDILAQGDLLREVLVAYREAELLRGASSLLSPGCPVVFTGMGSSLAAAQPAAARVEAAGLWATAMEAGELLHYGLDNLPSGSLVILVSQSGRSAETVAVGQRLRDTPDTRVIAIVNDVESPLAGLADLVLPMQVGPETTVSTKTYISTFIIAHALADVLVGTPGEVVNQALAADMPSKLASVAWSPEIAVASAARFSNVRALVVIGRGPSFAVADYGALILKEGAALPAEAMLGGSFRHGPIEIAGPGTGIIVLAPSGPTQSLSVRLAADTAGVGSPTWLLTGADSRARNDVLPETSNLTTTYLPEVPELLAPLLYCVPLQHLAVKLAMARNRQPGVVERSSKVTAFE